MEISDLITLEYELIGRNELQFRLTCQTQKWCSIGFGESFINIDLIRITLNDGRVNIEDLYSKN